MNPNIIHPVVTLDLVRSFHPCYCTERLERLAVGRKEILAVDVLNLPIPLRDKIWLGMRLLTHRGRVLVGYHCAKAVEHLMPPESAVHLHDAECWLAGDIDRVRRPHNADKRAAAWEAIREFVSWEQKIAEAIPQVSAQAKTTALSSAHAAWAILDDADWSTYALSATVIYAAAAAQIHATDVAYPIMEASFLGSQDVLRKILIGEL